MKLFSLNGLIIVSLVSVLILVIYLKTNNQTQIDVTKNSTEDISINSNIIKDIKYVSKDLKGNQYTILALEGEIDLNNADIIFLKKVTAYINLVKENEIIKITSDFGKYNTVNFDTIFSQNVSVDYIDNNLKGNYLDFSMINNLLIVSKNVVYTNSENILKADVVELNTITKDTKIYMYNSNAKVEVQSLD